MKNLKVVFLSDWLTNPYKELLMEYLGNEGVIVSEYFWSTFFLHKVLSKGVPNALHFHTIHPFLIGKSRLSRWLKLFLFAGQLLFLKLLGTRAVWTVHEWNNKLGDDSANVTAGQAVCLGKILHSIIAHCETTQRDIACIFKIKNTKKVVVIPHGNYIGYYPNNISTTEARRRFSIPVDDTVFLLFGDIYRYKGILESIYSFKRLDSPSATLLIAGLPREERLEGDILAAINDHPKIIFLPRRIPDKEVQLVMNTCDFVLVPYNVFTTSGVAVLAMSFGKACIAPDVGFFRDVLDAEGAFLYNSNQYNSQQKATINSLEDAMQKGIYAKSQALSMGKHNFRVAQNWNWQFVASKTARIYI